MQRLENWDDLRFFLAVARTGGLSAASRELGVNQSTVSRRITQLEEGLAARLFNRQARGYELTAVGERMLGLATIIEDDVLALSRMVIGADRDLRGTIRVTTVDELFERIAPHLKRFSDEYPGIDIEMNSDNRVYSLARGEADVAIRPGLRPTEDAVVGRKLVASPLSAYASPAYLAANKRPRRIADLAKHTLVSFGHGRPSDPELRAMLEEGRVVLRTGSMTGQAIAARAGMGVAVLPRFMGDPDPQLERLFGVPTVAPTHLWLLIHADLRQTARVRAFVDFMTESIMAERALYEGTRKRS
ncbi:MAG: LysR family transcriptional regulator [Myxococcota bacterium]